MYTREEKLLINSKNYDRFFEISKYLRQITKRYSPSSRSRFAGIFSGKPKFILASATRWNIEARSGSDAETLVIRINECRAFISLLKGPFECAKEGRSERGGEFERGKSVEKRDTKERNRGEEREREREKEVDQSSRWKAMPVNESP